MIDAPSILAGLIIGTGIGSIAMGVFAAGKYVEDCKFLLDQIDELQAWKDSVLAGIRKASADRAAERQASKRLAMREAAE